MPRSDGGNPTPGPTSHGLEMRTGRSKVHEPSADQVEAALRATLEGGDEFVVLSRGDDFVQFNGTALERGDGTRLWRLDLEPAASRVLGSFRAGGDVSQEPWRDVTHELAASSDGLRWWVAPLAIAIAFGICWCILRANGVL